MLGRLAAACCLAAIACSTAIVEPAPVRDVVVRVFNGSSTKMSNIRVNGGVDDSFASLGSLEHGDLSATLTVKTGGRPLTVIVDVPALSKTSLHAQVALLTEAQLASPVDPWLLTLRFEGERLVAELSQPVED
jgi:hypothetical protein